MELQPVNLRANRTIDLDFYALGKSGPVNPPVSNFNANKGFRSTSNDIFDRNYFSIRNTEFANRTAHQFKEISLINSQNVPENNYLEPLNAIDARKKFDLPTHMVNKETYNIAKEKLFARDKSSQMKNGQRISVTEFNESKYKTIDNTSYDPNPEYTKGSRTLKDNKLVFEMNNTHVIRPKGSWIPSNE
ncbi:MAG: hypothetical protein MJ252_21110 [archaeon]|nr:hypothetical protein [archaeon]